MSLESVEQTQSLYDPAFSFSLPLFPNFAALGGNETRDAIDELGKGHRFQIHVGTQTYRDGFDGCLFITNDKHVRDLLQLSITNGSVSPAKGREAVGKK
jgi:hypothetical protein